jgi:hypothetical protein
VRAQTSFFGRKARQMRLHSEREGGGGCGRTIVAGISVTRVSPPSPARAARR